MIEKEAVEKYVLDLGNGWKFAALIFNVSIWIYPNFLQRVVLRQRPRRVIKVYSQSITYRMNAAEMAIDGFRSEEVVLSAGRDSDIRAISRPPLDAADS